MIWNGTAHSDVMRYAIGIKAAIILKINNSLAALAVSHAMPYRILRQSCLPLQMETTVISIIQKNYTANVFLTALLSDSANFGCFFYHAHDLRNSLCLYMTIHCNFATDKVIFGGIIHFGSNRGFHAVPHQYIQTSFCQYASNPQHQVR